tara:strand:+ start:91 stop:1212 length:1122 start_codon:yes stop_codon:yes gene_type:complete
LAALLAPLSQAAPTGIGIGLKPGDRSNIPTKGKVTERPAPVTVLSLSADGKSLWVGDANGRLRSFALTLAPEGGGELGPEAVLPWKDARQAASIEAILVRPERTWIALDGGTFARATTSAIVATATRQREGVLALVAGPEGRLAAASAEGEIRIYDPQGGLQNTIRAHGVATIALASEPGKTPRIWSLGWDGRLCAWRWPKPAKPAKKGKGKGKVGAARAGHRRQSGRSRRASARKLDKPRFELDLGQREPTSLALIPLSDPKAKERHLIVADFQGRLRRVELAKRKLTSAPYKSRPNMELISALALSPSGERGVALASAEQTLLLFDPQDPERIPLVLQRFEIPPARALFLSETTVAVGFYDGNVRLIKVAK